MNNEIEELNELEFLLSKPFEELIQTIELNIGKHKLIDIINQFIEKLKPIIEIIDEYINPIYYIIELSDLGYALLNNFRDYLIKIFDNELMEKYQTFFYINFEYNNELDDKKIKIKKRR